MKPTIQQIALFIMLLSSCFTQGQGKREVLERQIDELKEKQNFITESACPQKEDVLKVYQANFDILQETLNIASMVYNTPITIKKDRIQEQGEKSISYQSTNIMNVIVKRYSSKISMAGIVSDNSSIPIGTRLLTETFTVNTKKIEVQYRITKNSIYLISLEAIYLNKTRVYLDLTSMPQSDFRVYNTSEYGTEFKKIQIFFSPFEIGRINILQVDGSTYELYREQYTEMSKNSPNQGFVRHRYAIRCSDENGNYITPKKKGQDVEIKPATYLLWYKGFIGKYPIHLMLKRGFVKEEGDVEINDTIISNVQYAYDSQKKWINIENLWERQAGIFGFEGQDDSPEWSVEFYSENFYNKVLTGNWDNQNGKILPVKLTPMTKAFPTVTFKAHIEEGLTPSGEVSNRSITALDIYQADRKIQQISFAESKPNLDYFELGYVDINYDGYLDLFVENNFFLYNPTAKRFDLSKDEEGEWDYIPNLTELYSYNPYTKSFTVQTRRSFIEYRVISGKITPYASESYYPGADGNMVHTKQKYINKKWEVIEERIEGDEELVEEDIDIGSSENYGLTVDITVQNKSLLFTPVFYNKTGLKLEFKSSAKLFVEMTGSTSKTDRKFLGDVPLNGEKEDVLNDNYISYTNGIYFLENEEGLIPFFPPNLNNGEYTFQLVLEHPLFGKITSKKQQIKLPLSLKEDTTIAYFMGNIGDKVKGSIYFKVNDRKVKGTFINANTGKNISLKGTYIGGFFGIDTVNLEEYEKTGERSGYFEGTINVTNKKEPKIYKGFWISIDKKVRVPFEFKQE